MISTYDVKYIAFQLIHVSDYKEYGVKSNLSNTGGP